MRLTEEARGTYVIAVTPFTPDGAIDWPSLDRAVGFYESAGADGLTILGMMGEAPKMTAAESAEIARRVIARTRLPVVVGVTAPGLAAMRELSGTVMEMGAAGVMVAPPAGLGTDAAVTGYFANVADALGDTPIVLQDFPLATKTQISDAALGTIVDTLPTVVMLKHEDWPGLAKITVLRARPGRRISVLCGNGGSFLPEEMARGADGAMTGYAYPEMMVGVIRAMEAGDAGRAHDLFDAHLPLIRYETQPGIGLAVRKHVLARRGAIAHASLRRPGAGLDAATAAEVDRLVDRLERRLKEIDA